MAESDEQQRRLMRNLEGLLPRPLARGIERALPAGFKRAIRQAAGAPWAHRVGRLLARRAERQLKSTRAVLAPATLAATLDALPITPGAIVFVHSSLSALGFVEGGPEAVVDVLVEAIVQKRRGTLVLPTFSMDGTMAETLRSKRIFDAATTPSGVGAITEAFRRRPGVLRSLHPTHSAAALGPKAEWITGTHHVCGSSFGPGSPLGRVLEAGGFVMGLGVSLGPVTFYHVLEDYRPDFPLAVYTADSPIEACCRDTSGREHRMEVMAHESAVAATRIDRPAGEWIRRYCTRALERRGGLQWYDVGHGRAWLVRAPDMYRSIEALMEEGITIYSTREEVLRRDPSAAEIPVPGPVEQPGAATDGHASAPGPLAVGKRMVRRLQAELQLSPKARRERRRDAHGLPEGDPGTERVLVEAEAWLCRAQDRSRTRDGGVARHYSLLDGWGPSYPETTGYIVPTMLAWAQSRADADARHRARRMLDWLVSIQLPDGGFQAGPIGVKPVPVTFNTGQILIGLAAGVTAFADAYCEPMRRAADWLVSIQDPDGAWRRHLTPFAAPGEKTYETHTAWGLLEAARAGASPRWAEAALRNTDWAISLQRPNGWLDRCCLTDASHPLTHTLGYALRGFVEAWRYGERPDHLAAARRLADGLLTAVGQDGFLAGRLAADWGPAVPWACLTGTVQVASCFFLLADATGDQRYGDAARRMTGYVRRTVAVSGDEDRRGAVKGSFPIDGDYGSWLYLNWAAKFLIDALLLETARPAASAEGSPPRLGR